MQELDTRTFPEIWATLGGQQKEDVTRALMLEGCPSSGTACKVPGANEMCGIKNITIISF